MVKRPFVVKTAPRSSRRRRASTDSLENSGGEGPLNQQNLLNTDNDLQDPSPETSNQTTDDQFEAAENETEDMDNKAVSDDEDASEGSSDGSSIEDPDDDFTPYSPPALPRESDIACDEPAFDEESGSSDDDFDNIEEKDSALYHGAPITVNESMLAILSLAFSHNLSRSCLDDLLQLISIHCPPFSLCKNNVSLFKKHFAKSKSLVVRHYYCTTCFESLQNRDQVCSQCNDHRGVAFFIEVPILPQLESMFLRAGFQKLLQHRFYRSKLGVNSYDDIYDGEVYKNLCSRGNILADGNNVSFTWYTDGVRLSNTSDNEIWPFYLTINELPFLERAKTENVLLAGVWFGPRKPVPHIFLKGIREDFHSLNKGVQFKVPDTPDPLLVRGIVMCGTCSLPAKALFLNMSHHSSSFGCQKCKIRSVKENNQATYKFQRYPQKRTYEETILYAQKAIRTRRSVYGVKGTSALSFVYRPIETTAIDMHDAYIGISKILNKIHFSEDHFKHPASLFGFLQLYDRRLCAIRPPYFVEKLPRSFSGFGNVWEASELKVNLMMYSLPLFQDIMSVFHFEHHMLLVYGLYLLSKDSVSEQDIELASEMLVDYCSRFEDLYGSAFMTCYVHQLMHLPTVVKDFGPLWVTSSTPFKGLNDSLRRFSQGNQAEELQVTSAASLFLHISKLKPLQPTNSRPVLAFCDKLSKSGKKLDVHSIHGHYCVIGKLRRVHALPEIVYVALAPLKLSCTNFYLFDRILNTRRNLLFSCATYDEGSKNISSCVRYQKNNVASFGRVQVYLRASDCECDVVCDTCSPIFYAIIHKLHVQPAYRAEPGGFIPFIHRCAELNEYEAIRVECLSHVCFLIEIEDRHDAFVVEPITTGSRL